MQEGRGSAGSEGLELEVKLLPIPPGDLAGILASEAFREAVGSLGKSTGVQMLTGVYFDSEERDLRKAGLVYRERESSNGVVATLKARAEGSIEALGLAARREWEQPIDTIRGEPRSLMKGDMRNRLETALAGSSMIPLFTVEVERQTTELHLEVGCRVELAIDRGRVFTKSHESPIEEIELELLEGPAQPMLALAATWQESFGLVVGTSSKFGRGEALLAT